jgi:hypothetical protein
MNGMPVANQREDEQRESDQQQAGSLRGINRGPLTLVGGAARTLNANHNIIVRPALEVDTTRVATLDAAAWATIRVVGRRTWFVVRYESRYFCMKSKLTNGG